MKTNKSILTPEGMYGFAGKALRPCFILAIIVILAAMYVGFFLAPVDGTQGNSYRILYIHVACAWMAMLLYVVMAVFCSLGLITENRPTWGAYWVWDARLTSALILFFFYLGYIALQNAIPDWRRADKACAVIGIVGVINVPIVYFSVQWWNTLHQGASITASGSSIHPVMLWALALMVIGFWLYTFAVTFVRLRSVILERERNQEWAQQLALKGEL